MNRIAPNTRSRRRAALGLAALGLSGAALAHLGGDTRSVANDQARVHGALRVTPNVNFTLHEISAPDGLRVQEYTAPDGTVFAVSWQGPTLPDLSQLLDSYFPAYVAAVAALPNPGLRRSIHVESGGLVVESSGHMRAFYGRAWAVALLPAGFSPPSIR